MAEKDIMDQGKIAQETVDQAMAGQGNLPQLAEQGQTDPLAELRDIHLPGAIPDWPPAPGWWLLGILILAITIYLGIRLYRYWKNKQYRREGIRALQLLKDQYESSPKTMEDKMRYLQRYSQLLKRVAFSGFPRDEVASLSGESWVAFLDLSGNTKEFSMGCGQVLIEGNYAQSVEFDYQALYDLGILWIKNHKRKNQKGKTQKGKTQKRVSL